MIRSAFSIIFSIILELNQIIFINILRIYNFIIYILEVEIMLYHLYKVYGILKKDPLYFYE